jgi:hypothetical protein
MRPKHSISVVRHEFFKSRGYYGKFFLFSSCSTSTHYSRFKSAICSSHLTMISKWDEVCRAQEYNVYTSGIRFFKVRLHAGAIKLRKMIINNWQFSCMRLRVDNSKNTHSSATTHASSTAFIRVGISNRGPVFASAKM